MQCYSTVSIIPRLKFETLAAPNQGAVKYILAVLEDLKSEILFDFSLEFTILSKVLSWENLNPLR